MLALSSPGEKADSVWFRDRPLGPTLAIRQSLVRWVPGGESGQGGSGFCELKTLVSGKGKTNEIKSKIHTENKSNPSDHQINT